MMNRFDFPDSETVAKALATAVAGDIRQGIAQRGHAALAVSGGETPKRFFELLSARDDIDWSRVTITLVDERWVDDNSDRSNARLVRLHLLRGPAAKARFVPLYAGGDEPTLRLVEEANRMQDDVPRPFDAVVLGLGNDGHTASFFPHGDALAEALSGEGPAVAMRAPGAGEPRITLTLPHLLATRALYLHLEGKAKATTLETALDPAGHVEEMPVRAVLRQQQKPVLVYWCP